MKIIIADGYGRGFTNLEEWFVRYQAGEHLDDIIPPSQEEADGLPDGLLPEKPMDPWFSGLNPTLATDNMIVCDGPNPDNAEEVFEIGHRLGSYFGCVDTSFRLVENDEVMPLAREGRTLYWGNAREQAETWVLDIYRPDLPQGRIKRIGRVPITHEICREMQTSGAPLNSLPGMECHVCADPQNWGDPDSPFREMWTSQ